MIKKATIATFNDGDYAGEYDWTGGIPLTVGEEIIIVLDNHQKLAYILSDKKTTLTDNGQDQEVVTEYSFNLNIQ